MDDLQRLHISQWRNTELGLCQTNDGLMKYPPVYCRGDKNCIRIFICSIFSTCTFWKLYSDEVSSLSQVDCRGDEKGLHACPHTYTTAGWPIFLITQEFPGNSPGSPFITGPIQCVPGCDTDTVAGVHCLPTPRQEAASKVFLRNWTLSNPMRKPFQVAFLVLGMALAFLLTVSGLGIFYLRFTQL